MEHIYDYPAFDIDLGLYMLYAKWNRKKCYAIQITRWI